jgi:ABC-2 type transport system ATP-binding protein
VLIINQGRVVAAGTPADLRQEIFGPGHYELELAGPLDVLAALLPSLHPSLAFAPAFAVASVGEDPAPTPAAPDPAGFHTLRLVAAPDAPDLREALVKALARDPRFRLRALARARHTLEEVFLVATQSRAA